MELDKHTSPATTLYTSHGSIEVSPGGRFRIQRVPASDGAFVLDEQVPAGKKWTVDVQLTIHEEDA